MDKFKRKLLFLLIRLTCFNKDQHFSPISSSIRFYFYFHIVLLTHRMTQRHIYVQTQTFPLERSGNVYRSWSESINLLAIGNVKQSEIFSSVCWVTFLISDRSFCRHSIGTRIDATLWRVRMISIKRVYPSRWGVGSNAMRVDGTSEYEISRRCDVARRRLEMITGDEKGWIAVPCREKGYDKNISFRGVNVSWQSRRPPEVTVRRLWGVVVGVFFEPRYAMCPRGAALRNKVSLVRSGVRQCRQIKREADRHSSPERRVASL